MKNYSLLYIFILLLVYSCNSKIDTEASYKDIALIWSFLDKTDTAHYIKIEKGYQTQNQSAFTIGQIADSLYFDNLAVSVEEINSSGIVQNTYTLSKVNLANEGYTKDTGVFASSPQYAYKFKATLNSSYTYKVKAVYNGKTYAASTPILAGDATSLSIWPASFTDPVNQRLNLKPTNKFNLSWNWVTNAYILDAILRFHYFEVNTNTPTDTTEYTLDWHFIDKLQDKLVRDKTINSYEFYDFLSQKITNKNSNIKRFYGKFDFFFYTSGQRFINYLNISGAQSGLTADQIKPDFTEGFESENTFGLFTTRLHLSTFGLQMQDSFTYYLQVYPNTSSLNFIGKKP